MVSIAYFTLYRLQILPLGQNLGQCMSDRAGARWGQSTVYSGAVGSVYTVQWGSLYSWAVCSVCSVQRGSLYSWAVSLQQCMSERACARLGGGAVASGVQAVGQSIV